MQVEEVKMWNRYENIKIQTKREKENRVSEEMKMFATKVRRALILGAVFSAINDDDVNEK
jgi:hypothetical protein